MEDFIEGLLGVVLGFVFGLILDIMIIIISPLASLLFNIIDAIATIHKMQRWGAGYLMGWLIGASLLFQAGLLNIFDIIINIIFPLFFLISIIKSIFD